MKLNAILLICAVIIAGGLMWYSTHNDSGTVPIIRADSSPIKERPENRGGMNIAHKDSTIYDTMRQNGDKSRVENLLAEHRDQSSINRDELFAGIKAKQAKLAQEHAIKELKDDESVNSRIAGNMPAEATTEAAEESTKNLDEPSLSAAPKNAAPKSVVNVQTPTARPAQKNAEPQQQSTAQNKPLTSLLAEVQGLKIDPIQKKKPAAAKAAQPASTNSAAFQTGNNFIQIGSLRTESAARSHWAARKKEFASALQGFSLRIEHIEIAGRGSFYRVQGGPASKQSAKQACATINQRHANSCIVK
jgi:uncharacterized protein YxeA